MSLNPTAFWFLRHGETDWNAEGLSQGHTDIPLNAVGISQAQRAALALVDRGIVTIIASPLSRALRTAEIVAEALALPVATDAGLMEVGFGVEEGRPMGDWYDSWIEGSFTPEGAESFQALHDRAVAAVNRATSKPGPVLVVAHGALFRALRLALGHAPNVRTPNALPLWCEPPASGTGKLDAFEWRVPTSAVATGTSPIAPTSPTGPWRQAQAAPARPQAAINVVHWAVSYQRSLCWPNKPVGVWICLAPDQSIACAPGAHPLEAASGVGTPGGQACPVKILQRHQNSTRRSTDNGPNCTDRSRSARAGR